MRITTTGVQPESYQEHLASLEVAAQGIFGSSFSLEPQTPQEQLFALVALAKAETDLQAVDLASAFSFSNAVGLALDRLGTFVGVLRGAEESDTAYFIRIEAERASGGSGSTENIESALTALTIVDKALVVQDLTNGRLTPVVAANVNLNASRRNTIAQVIMEKKPPGVELAGALNGAASVGGVTYATVGFSEATEVAAKVAAILKPETTGLVPADLIASALAAISKRVEDTPINTLVTVAGLEAAVQRVPGNFELVGAISITKQNGSAYNYSGLTYGYTTITDADISVTLQS